MANRIRRRSMEQLQLYDLDKLIPPPPPPRTFKLLPQTPPIPPPRKYRTQITTHSSFEYYKFLCDPKRYQTDSVYAATPMFTIIPQTKHVKYHRQLLGRHIPPEIIKPVVPTTSPKSPEPSTADTNTDKKEEPEEDDDDDDEEEEDNQSSEDDDGDELSGGSSSSSSSSDNDDDDILGDDDDDNKGVVEQIFNRDKKT